MCVWRSRRKVSIYRKQKLKLIRIQNRSTGPQWTCEREIDCYVDNMNDEKNCKTEKKQEKSEIKGTMKNCTRKPWQGFWIYVLFCLFS